MGLTKHPDKPKGECVMEFRDKPMQNLIRIKEKEICKNVQELLLDGEQLRLVLGSGGSKRIRTAIAQVISNLVDFGMAPRAAVEASRLHWDGERVQVEPGFAEASLAALATRWPVNRWLTQDVYFGGVNAVAPVGEGAGDPRRGGCAAVVEWPEPFSESR